MARLSLIFAIFLSTTMASVVFVLSLLAKVTFGTLLFRSLVSFFLFGILGAILGSVLEVLVVPVASEEESRQVKKDMNMDDANVEDELGDLLTDLELVEQVDNEKASNGMKPAVFPRMSVEKGKVVSRGDSAVIS
ncbi:MAG: hypothetical protein HQM09_00750 [Candidatus Riflebacteria bacterium]|nr:hypothetical protein [Candidatus Riflebacteria bacterium]